MEIENQQKEIDGTLKDLEQELEAKWKQSAGLTKPIVSERRQIFDFTLNIDKQLSSIESRIERVFKKASDSSHSPSHQLVSSFLSFSLPFFQSLVDVLLFDVSQDLLLGSAFKGDSRRLSKGSSQTRKRSLSSHRFDQGCGGLQQ